MLSNENIESELSYAYLHAVASRAGFVCEVASRHVDNAGIDAYIRHVDDVLLAGDSKHTQFSLEVQLKATLALPRLKSRKTGPTGRRLAFRELRIHQYDRLRTRNTHSQRILVVLRLPEDPEHWLAVSDSELMLRHVAYWVSLRGAPASENSTKQTVYLPEGNVLSPDSLKDLMIRVSRLDYVEYES